MRTQEAAERFGRAQVALLATADRAATPHLIPIVFALADAVIYTAVDGKRKSTNNLRRIRNIRQQPRVSVLVDHYHQDWTRLWWVRADGFAKVHEAGDASGVADPDAAVVERGYALLRAKYPSYDSVALAGPVITIDIDHWAWWQA